MSELARRHPEEFEEIFSEVCKAADVVTQGQQKYAELEMIHGLIVETPGIRVQEIVQKTGFDVRRVRERLRVLKKVGSVTGPKRGDGVGGYHALKTAFPDDVEDWS